MPKITIEISQVRYEWLQFEAARYHQSVEEIASAFVHNSSLDFQQALFPDTDPAQGTAQIKVQQHV